MTSGISRATSFTMSISNAVWNLTTKETKSNAITLSYRGLSFVNWGYFPDDFDFVFGDEVCSVPTVLAEILSPKVARLRRGDALCDCYQVHDQCSGLLSSFESLISHIRSGSEKIEVEMSRIMDFCRILLELENSELFYWLLRFTDKDSLTCETAIILLRAEAEHGIGFSDQSINCRDFVASHFHEIEKEILEGLDLETAQLVLSSPSLQIEDEDSLYDWIKHRADADLRFASLLEFVYIEYLSVDRIEDFASFVRGNLLECISPGIWRQICARLIRYSPPKRSPRATLGRLRNFTYCSERPLDGIIAYLTHQCGGNVHHKGVVNVTASSINGTSCTPTNAVDFDETSRFCSENIQNSWLCYDFQKQRIRVTSYSVRSSESGNQMKSWVLEGSNDGNFWTKLDRRDDYAGLTASCVTRNFEISNPPDESYRYIRLRQIGQNCHRGTWYYFELTALELFGTIEV